MSPDASFFSHFLGYLIEKLFLSLVSVADSNDVGFSTGCAGCATGCTGATGVVAGGLGVSAAGAGLAGVAGCAGCEHAVSMLTTSNAIQIVTKIALFMRIFLLTSLNSDRSSYADDLSLHPVQYFLLLFTSSTNKYIAIIAIFSAATNLQTGIKRQALLA
jgi:hypothetical protein